MVRVEGNGYDDRSSKPSVAVCVSNSANTLGKGIGSLLNPPAMDKW